jgi:hypothetical protein
MDWEMIVRWFDTLLWNLSLVNWDRVYNIVTLFVLSASKLYLSFVILRGTWHWTHVGRALMMMFLVLGIAYGVAVANAICMCLPDLGRGFRLVIIATVLYLAWALRTYDWPDHPAHIKWKSMLGLKWPQ